MVCGGVIDECILLQDHLCCLSADDSLFEHDSVRCEQDVAEVMVACHIDSLHEGLVCHAGYLQEILAVIRGSDGEVSFVIRYHSLDESAVLLQQRDSSLHDGLLCITVDDVACDSALCRCCAHNNPHGAQCGKELVHFMLGFVSLMKWIKNYPGLRLL